MTSPFSMVMVTIGFAISDLLSAGRQSGSEAASLVCVCPHYNTDKKGAQGKACTVRTGVIEYCCGGKRGARALRLPQTRCNRKKNRSGYMKTETWSPEETFQLGKRLGEQAQPGQIYTLSGRSGCRKNCIYKRSSSRTGHPSGNRSAVPPLP